MRLLEPVPNVVDTNINCDDGRFFTDNIPLETTDKVFGLLSTDSRVDDLGYLHVGILLCKDSVDISQITTGLRDGVADGNNLFTVLNA